MTTETATADDFLTTFEARCRKSGIWPEKNGETEYDEELRDQAMENYLSLNEGELITELGPEEWRRRIMEARGYRPSDADRQEMEAWRTVAALKTALDRLETGELLSDADGDIIAIKRPDGKGYGIWMAGQVTSMDVSTAKEAAERLASQEKHPDGN